MSDEEVVVFVAEAGVVGVVIGVLAHNICAHSKNIQSIFELELKFDPLLEPAPHLASHLLPAVLFRQFLSALLSPQEEELLVE